LIVASLICAPWPRLVAAVLVLSTIDLALGIGSFALNRVGAGVVSVLPPNFYPGAGFQWQPLLQAVPIPSLAGGVPGLKISNSAAGTRGRDYSTEELQAKTIVAAFGGSTTYDIGVSDDDMWTARLESRLGQKDFAVINHGVPGYSTVENLIQTAFYEDAFGMPPTCSIYYEGWNDIRNSHIKGLDAGYADYHLLTQIDALKVRRVGPDFVTVSPLFTIAARLAAVYIDTVRPAPAVEGTPQSTPDPKLEALFIRNVRAISAINRARSIRTFWVGQLLNVEFLRSNDRRQWTPLIRNNELWPLQYRLNSLLRQAAVAAGDVYIDVPIADFTPADFVDSGHFSVAGARKFAEHLAPALQSGCKR
jgi:lysophospholipase L1-like esterase